MHEGHNPFGNCDLKVEDLYGKPVVRARSVHASSGMKVMLTFPVGAAFDLGQFKERVVRSMLERNR